MFSAMCWLIVMVLSLYPNNMEKRLYPERVLACSSVEMRGECTLTVFPVIKKFLHVVCPFVQCPHYLLMNSTLSGKDITKRCLSKKSPYFLIKVYYLWSTEEYRLDLGKMWARCSPQGHHGNTKN